MGPEPTMSRMVWDKCDEAARANMMRQIEDWRDAYSRFELEQVVADARAEW
jgi:hypothetical protein